MSGRTDAERLNFVEEHNLELVPAYIGGYVCRPLDEIEGKIYAVEPTIRQAIDAAMDAEERE
ncbi:hypothetical protein [Gluconobacter albidus]|uniref:hypothetical protein n=1 Tax=Gluconobacter albidus TaxID=318683 RepID=UPI001B8D380D|nr:hypothetical protein [Gluconobacter albidus]MBS1028328.1 hypothetical protein [Gluconobacter albidus]MCP1274160.1 hypothetical protein [Gluconobacter albidus]